MRILVVSNLYPPITRGGYEVECCDVVDHLRAAHDVDVLTSDHKKSGCPTQDGVWRIMPFADHNRLGVLRAPLHALRGVRTMRRVLADRRPDLVYVWNASGLPYAGMRELYRAGLPIAIRVCEAGFGTSYDEDLFVRFLARSQRMHKAVWATVVRMVDRLPALRLGDHSPVNVAVCWNSEYLRSIVQVPPMLTPVFEAVVHPIHAAADRMAETPRLPADDPPVVLFVGRLEPQKGVDVLIRAVGELRRGYGRRLALRVVGAGDPTMLRELTRLADAEGVSDVVSFAGPLRDGALQAEVARAAAWVIPSRWNEAAPMVAIEAGLARVPVLASRVGGIPELLREPTEALYFDSGDAAGCAALLAVTLDGGPDVAERVRLAELRARELSFGPYLDRMDRFLGGALAAAVAPKRG